jgi:hypothetical protein
MPRHRVLAVRRWGTPAPPLNQGQRPSHLTPAAAALSNTTSGSSERTITASPPAAPHQITSSLITSFD